jgi:hypothetical protein
MSTAAVIFSRTRKQSGNWIPAKQLLCNGAAFTNRVHLIGDPSIDELRVIWEEQFNATRKNWTDRSPGSKFQTLKKGEDLSRGFVFVCFK